MKINLVLVTIFILIYFTENEVKTLVDESKKIFKRIHDKGVPWLNFSNPLIETKANFRFKIEKELVYFYKFIITALKTKRERDCIVEYSPDYNHVLPLAKIDPYRI